MERANCRGRPGPGTGLLSRNPLCLGQRMRCGEIPEIDPLQRFDVERVPGDEAVRHLSCVPFQVQVLKECTFLHFGTTREIIYSGQTLLHRTGQTSHAGAPGTPGRCVSINNLVDDAAGLPAGNAWVEGCVLRRPIEARGRECSHRGRCRRTAEIAGRGLPRSCPGNQSTGRSGAFRALLPRCRPVSRQLRRGHDAVRLSIAPGWMIPALAGRYLGCPDSRRGARGLERPLVPRRKGRGRLSPLVVDAVPTSCQGQGFRGLARSGSLQSPGDCGASPMSGSFTIAAAGSANRFCSVRCGNGLPPKADSRRPIWANCWPEPTNRSSGWPNSSPRPAGTGSGGASRPRRRPSSSPGLRTRWARLFSAGRRRPRPMPLADPFADSNAHSRSGRFRLAGRGWHPACSRPRAVGLGPATEAGGVP